MNSTPEAVRGQLNNINMNEDRVLTMAKSALKLANIIRYENGHEIIDITGNEKEEHFMFAFDFKSATQID